jgi:hypothetical protein
METTRHADEMPDLEQSQRPELVTSEPDGTQRGGRDKEADVARSDVEACLPRADESRVRRRDPRAAVRAFNAP